MVLEPNVNRNLQNCPGIDPLRRFALAGRDGFAYIDPMTDILPVALIVIFMIHLVVFAYLFFKHKKVYHLFFCAAFICLIAGQIVHALCPGQWPGDRAAISWFRYGAWLCTGIALIAYIRSRINLYKIKKL